MGHHFLLFENPVKARFAGQVNTLIRQLGNDLVGRQIPERRAVGDRKNMLFLLIAEFIGRGLAGAFASILTASLTAPSDDRPAAEADDGSCGLNPDIA
jgi:hypothetical protein